MRQPLVSVVLTTRDRPTFLQIALRCHRHQTYHNRELIVVDDGDQHPADPDAVAAAGGTLVRCEPGTTIGAKLNLGLERARGTLCQKMDDDDWYHPRYMGAFVEAFHQRWAEACSPLVGFITPFLFFDVATWEVRRSADGNLPGATLTFRRIDWEVSPFRNLPGDEDLWFYHDQLRIGAQPAPLRNPDLFVAIRHRGSNRDRGHTWTNQWNDQPLEDFLQERPLHKKPERLIAPWAIREYRSIRSGLLAQTESRG